MSKRLLLGTTLVTVIVLVAGFVIVQFAEESVSSPADQELTQGQQSELESDSNAKTLLAAGDFITFEPLNGMAAKEVTTNGLTLAVPKSWKVEERTMAQSGTVDGFEITSDDFLAKAPTPDFLGDEQLVLNGIRMTVSFQPEEVAETIQSSEAYFAFIESYSGNTAKKIPIMVQGTPMLLTVNSYAGSSNAEWVNVQGRANGKKIQLQIFYTGAWSTVEDKIVGIIGSIKFSE